MIVNLSGGHVIVVDGERELDISRDTTRPVPTIEIAGTLDRNILHGAETVPVYTGYASHKQVRNIPHREKGIIFIVPWIVAEAYPERDDFVIEVDHRLFRMPLAGGER